MEDWNRDASLCCPMCGGEDEEMVKYEYDGLNLEVTYTCRDCGIIYTIIYGTRYEGFLMGTKFWNKDGTLDNE